MFGHFLTLWNKGLNFRKSNFASFFRFVKCFRKFILPCNCRQFVSNKTKGRISKLRLQENRASQIFLKTNISYPLTRIKDSLWKIWSDMVCLLPTLVFLQNVGVFRNWSNIYDEAFLQKESRWLFSQKLFS